MMIPKRLKKHKEDSSRLDDQYGIHISYIIYQKVDVDVMSLTFGCPLPLRLNAYVESGFINAADQVFAVY